MHVTIDHIPLNYRRGIMKNRKRGFSLVELLIVLAVIAALIATITPVALNAIRKAQATKVAQNIKTLASAIENAAYVNGTYDEKIKHGPADADVLDGSSGHNISLLARDIDIASYGISYYYDDTAKKYRAIVYTNEDVDPNTANAVLSGLTTTLSDFTTTNVTVLGKHYDDEDLVYEFSFNVY